MRFPGEDAVDDPRADVAPSFPPAALLDDHAASASSISASASGSAPASGSAGSCAEEARMKKPTIMRMLIEWHQNLMGKELLSHTPTPPDPPYHPMRTRLPVNLSRVAELRDEASVDCEVDAFGGKPQSPVEPPPAHLYSDSSRVTNPIYYSGSEPASRNVCRSFGCGFLAHSEKGFRGYCCRMCENGKAHGKRCELVRSSFLRETRRKLTEDVASSL